MRILSEKRLAELLTETFEAGVGRGYSLGYQAGQVESRNRGLVLSGYDARKEAEEILRRTK